jgi:hypothetical protein
MRWSRGIEWHFVQSRKPNPGGIVCNSQNHAGRCGH